MKLTVYRPDGTALFDIIPDASSGHDWSLMTDNRLSLSFESESCTVLMPGCYVDFDGIRYYIIEEYKPTLVNSMQWKYNVTFKDAASWLAITVALNTIDGKNTPIFQYTAPAAEHAAIIVANLNRRMNTTAWTVGSVIDTGNISIDYNGKYCADVLQEIVDGEDTEWWVDGMTLNIGRAEFGNTIELGYRQGLLGNITCTQSDNMRSYAYLFPVGSTRNIDPTKYGYDRLQLPNGQTRVDMNVEQGVAELVEEKAFSHIFPRYIGKVTNVATSTGTSEDGEQFLIYFIEDKNIPFNPNDYELPGAVKHIIFQSGELMGSDFEVNYNATTHQFEIITQWPNGGGQLPGGLLIPAIGDEYVVWNISMPDEYYPRASQEFLEAAEAFAASAIKDASVYKATLDYIDARERGLTIRPGQRVRLLSDEYFSSGYYDSRITRITRKLDLPDAITIDVSAVRVIGTIQKLQNSLQSTASQVAQVTNTVQTVVQNVTNAVSLTGNQLVRGMKDFVDGLKIGGLPIRKINENTVFIDANVAFGGAATMFGKGSTTFPTIWANIPIDGNTIGRNEQGELYVIGGTSGGGGVADSVAWANITEKPTWIGADKPSYSYSEILETPDLGGFVTTESLTELLSGKADKATKLAEYGITDAYTKDELDAEFKMYMLKDKAQRITAQHDFTNGLLIDGLAIRKSADKTFYFDGNLVVSGAITMFGKDSTTFPTIWANIPFNPNHMKWDGSQWSVVGGGGGASVTYDSVVKALGYTPLNKTGDILTVKAHQYTGLYGINMQNSNIVNLNAIFTSDVANDPTEGIQFKRSNGNFDSIWASDGVLHFSPDGNTGMTGNYSITHDVLHTGNYTDYVLSKQGGEVNGQITSNAVENFVAKGTGYSLYFGIGSGQVNRGIYDLTNDHWWIYRDATLNTYIPNGNVAIGGKTADEKLHVHGAVKADSITISPSNISGRQDGLILHDKGTGTGEGLKIRWTSASYLTGSTLYAATNADQLYFNDSLVLTAKNYSNYALSISGGTVNGKLELNSSAAVNLNSGEGVLSIGPTTSAHISIDANDIQAKASPTTAGVLYLNTFGGKTVIGSSGYNVTVDGNLVASNTIDAYPIGSIHRLRLIADNAASYLQAGSSDAKESGVLRLTGYYASQLQSLKLHAIDTVASGHVTIGGALLFDGNDNYERIQAKGSVGSYASNADAGFKAHGSTYALFFGIGSGNVNRGIYDDYYKGWWLMRGNSKDTTLDGNLTVTGAVTFFSQASLKNVINHEGLSLDELAKIRPARFKWKDGRDDRVHVGVIAENILPILPEVVYFTGEEKTKTVDYASLATHIGVSLIKPVIDHETRIKHLEAQVQALKEENKQLKQRAA